MAVQKRKRVSKKSKKSWRKNVDITDVDNFLEDKRLEERIGINFSEAKNEDFFSIDTKGDSGNSDRRKLVPTTIKYTVNSVVGKRLRETEVPKCFENIFKRSAVPVPIKISQRVKSIGKRKPIQRKLREKRKIVDKSKVDKNKSNVNDSNNAYDVWSSKDDTSESKKNLEWVSNETFRHTLKNCGKFSKETPKSINSKTSLLPAIETPHPGLSYNPSLKDHKNILQKVAQKEIKLIKEEQHLNRVTTKMFSKVSREQAEKDVLSEMTVGLTMYKSDSDEDDGEDYKALNPPVRNKKKTVQKRKKLKEAQVLKEKQKRVKIDKKKLTDICKVKKLNEILNKRDEKTIKNIEKRKKIKEKQPYSTKVLSQTKFVEPETDFLLPEELSGNLRNVKPEGNILYDHFKSLQRRNILPPTVKRHSKKRKTKQYERAHTKMGWEPKGYVPFEPQKKLKKK